ncbi:4Fe-4S binding protein [Desulfitobacterium sp. AusDCA]|uniref:4Fe-4S binding protein n=1 Tax=Desulfitobacterium sp. AusDCA TaxID=3240383 RepID=UPI003DA717BD
MSKVDYKALKAGGLMRQIQKDHFSMRLKVVGGQVTAEHLKKVYEIAEKYGHGYVHLTSRQGIEIPFIKLEDIEKVKQEMATVGLLTGVCGPRVRTITACQGSTVCPNGLIDTIQIAEKLDLRYAGRELPHKFKFGVTGCNNNCLKAEENDLGIKGGIQPKWEEAPCTFCGLCEAVCPKKAIQVKHEDKSVILDLDPCNFCGKCVKSCPTKAWSGKNGYTLYFGGLFGNQIATGKSILPMIFEEDELFKVTDQTLEFFKKHGKSGERFGKTLNRVGWEEFEKELKEALKQ